MSKTISAGTRMILAVVVLVCAGLASPNAAAPVSPTLTQAQLLEQLKARTMNPDAVISLLKATTDKNQEGAIVGRYSVNQLLELSSRFQVDQCAGDEIERRQGICNELEDNIDNLFDYCNNRLFLLKNWCKTNGEAIYTACFDGLTEFNRKTLVEFTNGVKILSKKHPGLSIGAYVHSILDTKDKWYMVNLKASCTKFNQARQKFRSFIGDDVHGSLMVDTCQVIKRMKERE